MGISLWNCRRKGTSVKARNDELLTTNKEEKGSSKVTQFAGSVAGLGFLFPKRQLDSFDNKLHQIMN